MRSALVIVVWAAPVMAGPDLGAPAVEVVKTDVKIDLPPLPSFDVPAGPLTVKRLRVAGKPLLGTRVVLHGFVTFAYDCATQIRKPGETDRAVHARIDADPTLCERPKFYVGDTKTTPRDKSVWVVDVPRPYNKLELANLPKSDRTAPDRCEPNEKDPAKLVCPPYKVGDEVIVDGTFAVTSRHGERNSDGLIAYDAMSNVTRKWQTPGAKLDPTIVAASAAPVAKPRPAPIQRVTPAPIDPAKRQESIRHGNEGSKAFAQKQLDTARTEYEAAVQTWDGNHIAWYGLGGTLGMTAKWREAADAFHHALALEPDVVMYRMYYGIALYEDHHADDALAQLAEAVKLAPDLWRAHYYLGRIARDGDRPGEAAEQLALAIRANPREWAPYVALGELLRRWDYTDQAIQVLAQGTTNVPGHASELWLALGMAYFDKPVLAKAIEAFGHALDADPANHRARFQRGIAYFHAGDRVHAKRDLEEFVKADSKMGFEIAVAGEILGEIAAKH